MTPWWKKPKVPDGWSYVEVELDGALKGRTAAKTHYVEYNEAEKTVYVRYVS